MVCIDGPDRRRAPLGGVHARRLTQTRRRRSRRARPAPLSRRGGVVVVRR